MFSILHTFLRDIRLYNDRRLLILVLLGFSSGVPLFLTSSTLAIWLGERNINYTTIGFFSAASFPYALKFLWAPCIDRVNWPWLTEKLGRRRSWLFISQLILMVGLSLFATFTIEQHLYLAAGLALLVSFAAATQESTMLAYQLESLSRKSYGPGDALCILGYRIGMLVSGAGALYIATHLGWEIAYLLMALCIGVGLLTVLVIKEPVVSTDPAVQQLEQSVQTFLQSHQKFSSMLGARMGKILAAVICPFLDFMRLPYWWVSILLMFIYKLGDNLVVPMTNLFYMDLGFSKIELAQAVKAFGMQATILGGIFGGILIVRLGFIRSMFVFCLLHAIANSMYLVMAYTGHNLSMLYIAVALEHITSGMKTNALMAYQLTLCNVSYAATQLALMTSCVSLGRTIFSIPSGWLADQLGWYNFFSVALLANIPALILLLYLLKWSGEFLRQPKIALSET